MILKHRDRELLRFEWVEPQGVRILSVNDAERKFLPLEMRGEATDERLWDWLRHRVVPKHRNYIQMMLDKLGIDFRSVRAIIEVSKGLSLNDVHWVVPDGSRAKWSKVNLYDNPFSEILSVMAFTGLGPNDRRWPQKADLTSTSPEFTTNGMLAKCWRRIDGTVYLYKSGTEGAANNGFEPYSEYYASQIAEALGLPHVEYGLENFKGRLCSTCPLFTDERHGFIAAGRAVGEEAALKDERFADMFFFDALIFNTDRHLGNFGYMIDNDTNEITGVAPIFDNGYGLFSLALDDPKRPAFHEFDDLRKFLRKTGPALYTYWLGFPGGVTTRMRALAAKLRTFRFKRHPYHNLSDERLGAIEEFICKRANQICEFGKDADRFIYIREKSGTVNPVNEQNGGAINGQSLFKADESLSLQIKANLKTDPFITRQELAQILGIPLRTLSRRLKELRDVGEIRRVGSPKKGYWEVIPARC